MDYSEMLFAFHVRELAVARRNIDRKNFNMDEDSFNTTHPAEKYVVGVVNEMKVVAKMIRDSQAAD